MNLTQLWSELKLISKYQDGDKFGIDKNNNLKISGAGFLQGVRRTFQNLSQGGYNRHAVAERFRVIADEVSKLPTKEKEHYKPLLWQVEYVVSEVQRNYKPKFLEKKDVSHVLLEVRDLFHESLKDFNINNYEEEYSIHSFKTFLKWNGPLPKASPHNLKLEDNARLI